MNIGVPSRFACLNIEDDDDEEVKPKVTNNKKTNTKLKSKKHEGANKTTDNKNSNSSPKRLKNEQKKQVSTKQWEEWKQKDDEYVNGNFEEDLQNAILLSKLEYEEKKDLYAQNKQESDRKSKKKKNKTVSLNEFLGTNATNEKGNLQSFNKNESTKDENFFERISLEAKGEVVKEKNNELRKKREENIEEVISLAQFQEKFQKEVEKNKRLTEELKNVREELKMVKCRNKTLCDILGHGEMKDKADVLLELERLKCIKNELSDEVNRLHVLLEQERSKVASLENNTKQKDKKNKKHA